MDPEWSASTATILHDAFASSALPLGDAIGLDMGQRLGADFTRVRIHTGAAAGRAARALGARAWSSGRDIFFAPGHYAPKTVAGRELLTHELVHVAQDDFRDHSRQRSFRLDRPDSVLEHEATTLAAGVHNATTDPGPAPQAAPQSGPPIIHRALGGAILGGVLGGAGGVGLGMLAGSLLGPMGMIIGGVAGGLAGAVGGGLLGDVLTRDSRRLTADEKTYLQEIFHDAVDYDEVTISRGSAASVGSATTTGNTINLQDRHFKGDTMNLSAEGLLVLAHEMGHVWQYQNGGLSYIPSSLIPQIIAWARGESRNAAYNWRDAERNRIDWTQWNAEQQAQCISDYNAALRRIQAGTNTLADHETVALATRYISFVRQRIGAPGSSRRRRQPAQTTGTTR